MYSTRANTYNDKVEKAVNDQINLYTTTFYHYLNLAQASAQERVALHGFKEYFGRRAERIFADSTALMSYQNQRGGKVRLDTIQAPKVSSQ